MNFHTGVNSESKNLAMWITSGYPKKTLTIKNNKCIKNWVDSVSLIKISV